MWLDHQFLDSIPVSGTKMSTSSINLDGRTQTQMIALSAWLSFFLPCSLGKWRWCWCAQWWRFRHSTGVTPWRLACNKLWYAAYFNTFLVAVLFELDPPGLPSLPACTAEPWLTPPLMEIRNISDHLSCFQLWGEHANIAPVSWWGVIRVFHFTSQQSYVWSPYTVWGQWISTLTYNLFNTNLIHFEDNKLGKNSEAMISDWQDWLYFPTEICFL